MRLDKIARMCKDDNMSKKPGSYEQAFSLLGKLLDQQEESTNQRFKRTDERLDRMDSKLDDLRKDMNKRFDALDVHLSNGKKQKPGDWEGPRKLS